MNDERRFLITGGVGFIGSHLTERLLHDGQSVTIIDDLSTGAWSNIRHLEHHPRLRVIIASATERDLITMSSITSPAPSESS